MGAEEAGSVAPTSDLEAQRLHQQLEDLEARLKDLERSTATESSVRVALAKLVEAVDGDVDFSADIGQQGESLADGLEKLAADVRANTEHREALGDGREGPQNADEAWDLFDALADFGPLL